MSRKAFHNVLRFFFRILTKLEIINSENIPVTGSCIAVANHINILDGPLIFAIIDRQDATGLAAKKYQKRPLIRWLINSIGGIWINRREPDAQALRAARKYLRDGGILGIAPEGTRSSTAEMIEAKPGAAYLADLAQVPVLPMAITGTETALKSLLRLRRGEVTVSVGKMFTLPQIRRTHRDQDLQANTDEIMCRIASLLPERYRGVYADHPRTLELQK